MIKKYNLTPPAAARVHAIVSGAIYTATTAVYDEKYHYLRPRPTDLDPSLELPHGFAVPPHPAYPSGHSASAEAANTVLSYIFPHEAATFENMSREASLSRMKAGIHFKSDRSLRRRQCTETARIRNQFVGNDVKGLFYIKQEELGWQLIWVRMKYWICTRYF